MAKKEVKIEKEIPIKITIEAVKNRVKWNYNCNTATFLFYLERVKHLTQLEMDKSDKEKVR